MRDIQPVLDALSSPVRREILWLIWDDELPAGRIAEAFDVTAPTVSAHLAVLRDAGLVTMRRDGNFRRYRARKEAFEGLESVVGRPETRWRSSGGHQAGERSTARRSGAVVVSVDAACRPATAFAGFTDAATYSRWVGGPVTIDGNRFSCSLPWGRQVRGTYDVVAAPSLIAMRWDSALDTVPLPGYELHAYLRITPRGHGCHIEVHQLVDTDEQAEFLTLAWGWLLDRVAAAAATTSSRRRHVVE